MPTPEDDKITPENLPAFAKSVDLPVLGVVPEEKSLKDEFMRPGALDIGGFVDTANPVIPGTEEPLHYDILDEVLILRRGNDAVVVTWAELKNIYEANKR